MYDSPEDYKDFLEGLGRMWIESVRQLAANLSVPYLEEHEHDRSWRSRDNMPQCFLDIPKALERLGNDALVGIYFHTGTLNVVLVGASGARIGIRSSSIQENGWLQLVLELQARKVRNNSLSSRE